MDNNPKDGVDDKTKLTSTIALIKLYQQGQLSLKPVRRKSKKFSIKKANNEVPKKTSEMSGKK